MEEADSEWLLVALPHRQTLEHLPFDHCRSLRALEIPSQNCLMSSGRGWLETASAAMEGAAPWRHPVVAIPPLTPIVLDLRPHELICSGGQSASRAVLPDDAEKGLQ